MGERRKRWRPWDLNRLAADIAADILGQRKSAWRTALGIGRRNRQAVQSDTQPPKTD